jgi:hypothetical protein
MPSEEFGNGIVFPIVRLVRDEEFGFAPEQVTRKEFEILQYEYAAAELSEFWYTDKLSVMDIELPDLCNEFYKLLAILPTAAASEFTYATKQFNSARRHEHKYKMQSTCGYSWGPVGETDGFGYDAPVDAWLIAHPGGSVLFYRPADETIEDYFHKWAAHWIQQPKKRWPDASNATATLIVPTDMKNAQRVAMGKRALRYRQLSSVLFR